MQHLRTLVASSAVKATLALLVMLADFSLRSGKSSRIGGRISLYMLRDIIGIQLKKCESLSPIERDTSTHRSGDLKFHNAGNLEEVLCCIILLF